MRILTVSVLFSAGEITREVESEVLNVLGVTSVQNYCSTVVSIDAEAHDVNMVVAELTAIKNRVTPGVTGRVHAQDF